MRKQTRNKRAACALCKPHKRGWANRWRAADRGLAAAHTADMKQALGRNYRNAMPPVADA